jgi:hypothetical protein
MLPNKNNEPKEKTAVQVCIERSKNLSKMRKAKLIGRTFHLALKDCPMVFPSEDKLKDLQEELKNRIAEYEIAISTMVNIIIAPHGLNVDLKYWFSEKEIQEGYVLLRKQNSLQATHVLFLRNMEDTFDSTKVKEGEVKLYNHVNHFLERIDAEIELKKAQKKSKKNEQNT